MSEQDGEGRAATPDVIAEATGKPDKQLASAQLAAEQLAAEQLATAQLAEAELAAAQLAHSQQLARELAAEQFAASEAAAAELVAAQLVVAEEFAAEQLATSHVSAARLASEQLALAQLTADQHTAKRVASAQQLSEQLAASVSGAAELAAAQLTSAELLAATQLVIAEELAAAELAARGLAEAEEESRLAMDHSGIGTGLVTEEGRFTRVNPALCTLFGHSAEQLKTMTLQQLTRREDRYETVDSLRQIHAGTRNSHRMLTGYNVADGKIVWGDLNVSVVRFDDLRVRYVIVQIVDVTDRIVAEQVVAEREEMLRVVLDSSGDATMRVDRDLRVEYVNLSNAGQAGIPAIDWIGKTWAELGFPADLCAFWNERYNLVITTGQDVTFEFEIQTPTGKRWYESLASAEFAPDGSVAHVISTSRDVTDRKADAAELIRLATHDSLTGLANRAALLEELDRALSTTHRSGRPTAVLMIDVDRFKDVNDSLGHGAGDELLIAAADRLRASAREGDLIARPGGDEFVIVMRDINDANEAMRSAWKIVQTFREPFTGGPVEVFSTVSVGVTIATSVSTTDDLVREADTAMYLAKNEGRDRATIFNEDLRAVNISRLTLESELRHALERNELVTWFQPEVDLATGRVIAVEALLRWRHPSGELLTADRFIDIAEDTSMIIEIGAWVLEQSCAQAVAWSRERPDRPLKVRVNASGVQLAERNLLSIVDGALSSSGLDPSSLCIEITETALLRDTDTVRTNLEGLRERGITIAIDDFGTGYASLTYLRKYRIDVIKIDRSFITNIATDNYCHQLVAGIVAFAHHLNMTVTAEGVEDEVQAGLLRKLICPGAQGFLFAKAVPPEEISALLDHTFVH